MKFLVIGVNKPRKKEVCDSTKRCSNFSSITVCHLAFKLVVFVSFAIKYVIVQHMFRIYFWVKSRCTSSLNHKLPFSVVCLLRVIHPFGG